MYSSSIWLVLFQVHTFIHCGLLHTISLLRSRRAALHSTIKICSTVGQTNVEQLFFIFFQILAHLSMTCSQMPLLGQLFPNTIHRGVITDKDASLRIQTHVSRVAPDWDLWRTLYRLSYSTVADVKGLLKPDPHLSELQVPSSATLRPLHSRFPMVTLAWPTRNS